MATKKAAADIYSNRTTVRCSMTAVNTLVFQQLRFAAGLFEGVALILNRILWFPFSGTLRELVGAADHLQMALVTRNDLASIDPTNLAVIDEKELVSVGAAVERYETPLVSDWRNSPGGGLIIPANPLYLAMNTAGYAAVAEMNVVIEYQWKKLSKDESIELLQTLIPGTV